MDGSSQHFRVKSSAGRPAQSILISYTPTLQGEPTVAEIQDPNESISPALLPKFIQTTNARLPQRLPMRVQTLTQGAPRTQKGTTRRRQILPGMNPLSAIGHEQQRGLGVMTQFVPPPCTPVRRGLDYGMCSEHIKHAVDIAVDEHACMIFRMGNKVAFNLIRAGYHVKSLNIKNKSSDWGPHAGFIPYLPEFSKDPSNVKQGYKNGQSAIIDGMTYNIIKYQLALPEDILLENMRQSSACRFGIPLGQPYTVRNRQFMFNKTSEGKVAVSYLVRGGREWKPLEVIGYTSKLTPRWFYPVTADYDLFALFPHTTSDFSSKHSVKCERIDPQFGLITSWEDRIRCALNNRFDSTDQIYGGRPLVWHGMELRNPSPMDIEDDYVMMVPNGCVYRIPGWNVAATFAHLAGQNFYVIVNEDWGEQFLARIDKAVELGYAGRRSRSGSITPVDENPGGRYGIVAKPNSTLDVLKRADSTPYNWKE